MSARQIQNGKGVEELTEFIDEGEFEFASRGRKAKTDAGLLAKMKDLAKAGKGKGLALTEFAGDPSSETYTNHRAKVSANIRKHADLAGVAVRIRWTLQGVPFVSKTK